jgi:hypothetical protein
MGGGARRWRQACAAALGTSVVAVALPALATPVPDLGPTATVGGSGRVLFRDPVSPATSARLAVHRTAVPDAAYPLDRTFALHSLPGSQHTIFLDFDGAEVSGTAWNEPDVGLAPRWYGGWALDDGLLSTTGLRDVQSIWQRVAEDFAPFDVDVTTQDPGQDALDRSGPDDPAYGTRVLVTSSRAAMTAACPDACSGSAWFDVFDTSTSHDFYQPAFVFPEVLGNDVKDIADVISHEVGHNFGLMHDGTAGDEYYGGHRAWAPIMGAGYGHPIVQWSRGEYAGADNQQDDLALIAAHGAPLRADEAGGTPADAAALPVGPAVISSDADVDVYALGTCAGPVTVQARPAPVSPDLDIRLRLVRPDGTVAATANPPSWRKTYDRARGLSASVTTTVVPGSWFVSVEGVGHRGPVRGYSGYASVGSYTVRQTGCVAAPGSVSP